MITAASNDNCPLYIQVKNNVEKFIKDNNLKPGDKIPDIKTIAASSKVSLRTADLGIMALVEEGVCYRRPKKGTFVGKNDPQEQDIKNICAIYYNNKMHEYQNDLINTGINRGITAAADHYDSQLFIIRKDIISEAKFLNGLSKTKTCGILISYCQNLEEIVTAAKHFPEIRFVLLNYRLPGFENTPDNIFGVFNADYGGAYIMAEHLLRRQCRKPVIFSLQLENDNYIARVNGFLAAFRDRGIPSEQIPVFSAKRAPGESLQAVGRRLYQEAAAGKQRSLTAICCNDIIAEGVLEAAGDNGEKITVTGYDNITEISRYHNFSTLAINLAEIGQKGIEIIFDRDQKFPKQLEVSPQLIIRN
ncbi:MAG: GntR family transcriptional regulator [Victivallaceae bacterium]